MTLREAWKKTRMELWTSESKTWWFVGLHTPWGVLRVSLQPPEGPTTPLSTWGTYGQGATGRGE